MGDRRIFRYRNLILDLNPQKAQIEHAIIRVEFEVQCVIPSRVVSVVRDDSRSILEYVDSA